MDMKEIYEKIAIKNGISVEEVEQKIRAAIAKAYEAPNVNAQNVYYEGEMPTPEEFLAHVIRKVLGISE